MANTFGQLPTQGFISSIRPKGVVQRYASTVDKDYQLPLDNAHFIHKDVNPDSYRESYWVATNADGLIRFELDKDKKVSQFKKYTTKDGLSSNLLYTIIEDDKERLWISTVYGISCLDKKTENIQIYHELDGLPETEFNRAAYYKAQNGRIYFGSIKGIISFDPDELAQTQKNNSALHITRFEKYNRNTEQFANHTEDLRKKSKNHTPAI